MLRSDDEPRRGVFSNQYEVLTSWQSLPMPVCEIFILALMVAPSLFHPFDLSATVVAISSCQKVQRLTTVVWGMKQSTIGSLCRHWLCSASDHALTGHGATNPVVVASRFVWVATEYILAYWTFSVQHHLPTPTIITPYPPHQTILTLPAATHGPRLTRCSTDR